MVLIFHYAQMPAEAVIRIMEIFMTEVKPALDELTDYAPTQASGPATESRKVTR